MGLKCILLAPAILFPGLYAPNTIKGENMLSMGSILLHLIVDPFKTCFSQHGTDTLAPEKCIYVPLWLGALSVIRWFCCGCCFVAFVASTVEVLNVFHVLLCSALCPF